MPSLRTVAVGTVVALGAVATAVVLVDRGAVPPLLDTSGCTAEVDGHTVEVDLEQAENAALITAISVERGMPARAASIALATAYQESKLYNIDYGDRDSVGLFQQRTSQGWGSIEQLMDPVYATNKFFAELVKVKNYRKIPLADAAQAVQRSAGGYAYAPHEPDAKILAAAFTGRVPRAVHCWYPPGKGQGSATPRPQTAEARRQLSRALGGSGVTSEKRGWLIAAWSVAHARKYGLSRVGFSGAMWVNDTKVEGWRPGGASGGGRVDLS